MTARAAFSDMQDSTAEDWKIIGNEFRPFAAALPDRVLDHLKLLNGDFGGYPVDRLEHSLQTATRAWRDGKDEEYVVCALLHDIGDTLGSFNHPDIAAAILKPFVSEENLQMVALHGIFQSHYFFHHLGMDRNLRDQYKGRPIYDRTLEFCEKYDAPAFDASYESLPLSFFEPMLRRVMAKPKNTIYRSVVEENEKAA
ncbi:Predicted HD phosphohydrolase [Noviherbaspirillum humi]|uniref:Predicted HD phosphohydrolase n=1 Tax=Noviherbaspirillum humi TaxID=1688639 RepID=A0A239G3F4_9BURK|nr:HD domain-containing protein [Noviherbaspirillum humi]SNS63248.1 Predicted HD phosphohydrolase [Noviherbaspirillum humi]